MMQSKNASIFRSQSSTRHRFQPINRIELSQEKKLAVIEAVLDEEVRPYVELDAGGIVVQQLIDDKELAIAYQGACTSCFSAIGTMLSTIQQIVQTKVHPELIVVPNMDALKL